MSQFKYFVNGTWVIEPNKAKRKKHKKEDTKMSCAFPFAQKPKILDLGEQMIFVGKILFAALIGMSFALNFYFLYLEDKIEQSIKEKIERVK